MEFWESIKQRRSNYTILPESVAPREEIEKTLHDALYYLPSGYNMQSARLVLLYDEGHKDLWEIVRETLRDVVADEEKFKGTNARIDGFAKGYATVLYYEDRNVMRAYQEQNPKFAENFVEWTLEAQGMVQFAIWTALTAQGFGANLQHYNPLIDERVASRFAIPEGWQLMAQMPFGKPSAPPEPREYRPVDGRLLIR